MSYSPTRDDACGCESKDDECCCGEALCCIDAKFRHGDTDPYMYRCARCREEVACVKAWVAQDTKLHLRAVIQDCLQHAVGLSRDMRRLIDERIRLRLWLGRDGPPGRAYCSSRCAEDAVGILVNGVTLPDGPPVYPREDNRKCVECDAPGYKGDVNYAVQTFDAMGVGALCGLCIKGKRYHIATTTTTPEEQLVTKPGKRRAPSPARSTKPVKTRRVRFTGVDE